MTEILSDTPKLPKWPFLALDALLLATAALIAMQAGSPLDGVALCCVVGCVVLATFVCMLPFLVDYAREQDRVMDERRRVLEGMTKSLVTSSEQVEQAVKGVANLSDQVRISLGQMETLPGRLKEELARVELGLQSVRNEEIQRLQQELGKERQAASIRMDQAAENVAKAMLELARIEGLTADFEANIAAAVRELQEQTQAGASQIGSLVSGTLETLAKESAKRAEENGRLLEQATRARAEALERVAQESETRQAQAQAGVEARLKAQSGEIEARLHNLLAETELRVGKLLVDLDGRLATKTTTQLAALEQLAQASEAQLQKESQAAEARLRAGLQGAFGQAETRLTEVETRVHALLHQIQEAGKELQASLAVAAEVSVPAAPQSVLPSQEPSVAVQEVSTASPVPPSEPAPAMLSVEEVATPVEASSTEESTTDEDDVEPEAVPAQGSVQDETVVPPAPEPEESEEPEQEAAPASAPVFDLFSTDYDFEKAMTSHEEQPVSVSLSTDGMTRLLVTSYVGQGNKVFIRGEGQTTGIALEFLAVGKWRWQTNELTESIRVRVLKNDRIECPGLGEIVVEPGHQTEVTAKF